MVWRTALPPRVGVPGPRITPPSNGRGKNTALLRTLIVPARLPLTAAPALAAYVNVVVLGTSVTKKLPVAYAWLVPAVNATMIGVPGTRPCAYCVVTVIVLGVAALLTILTTSRSAPVYWNASRTTESY